MRIILPISAALIMIAALTIAPSFAQEGSGEWEPNGVSNSAYVIDEDQFVVDGTIGAYDEDYGSVDTTDWFALRGHDGPEHTFTMTFNADQVEIDWEIYDFSADFEDEYPARLLASMTDQGVSPETATAYVEGTCYIKVWAVSGSGDYRLTVDEKTCQGVDEVEPNDTIDAADSIRWDMIEAWVCENDSDWFVLTGQEGSRPTFELRFDDEKIEVDWAIYSDDSMVYNGTGYGSPETVTCEVPGTCYIHVWQYSGEGPYMVIFYPNDYVDR